MLAGTGPRGTAIVGIDPAWIVEPVLAPASRLFLYGAGHVGRAVVHALSGLDFSIDWIDVAADRFPTAIPAGVSPIVAADPVAMARGAPAGAFHVVMTFSHALDEAIVAALLARGDFAYLGLIGSRTKRARFVQRLLRAGISDSVIARLVCPIGGTGVAGKTPARIALSLALELVRERDRLSDADVHRASG
jgi:xanthine dehydrogenase accessory factor